jgi:hypothetical protein
MGPFDAPINDARARFEGLLLATERPGMWQLLKWLADETDFYTAPASTKHHGAVEGGLLEHSLAVESALEIVCEAFNLNIDIGTRRIVALLHDLCKVNFYTVEMRNKKDHVDENGVMNPGWNKFPFFAINDTLPYGHGEKSVWLAERHIRLTLEESMAIRWHMGLADTDYSTRCALNQAMQIYPLILALQMADQAATFWDQK